MKFYLLASFFKQFQYRGVKILGYHLIFMKFCILLFSHSVFGNEKPNFIVVVSDSHPISAVGAYKRYLAEVNPTPNIDKIIQNSVLFTHAFCTNASSGPSGAVLLTGKHSHINGFIQNGNKFNTSQESLPQLLQKAGYLTALLGRWDLGTQPKHFDYWNILIDPAEKYNPEFLSTSAQKRIEGHSTDIITDLTLQWLDQREKNKPFFLLVQFNATSKPWIPAIRHLNLFDDKLLPEPQNLKDDHSGKASPARYQSMDINNDLNFSDDLFFQSELMDNNQSNSIEASNSKKNLNLMTPEQVSAWTFSWRPKNEALLRDIESDENIMQFKFQRFIKNYLRCVRGMDENIKRLDDFLSEQNASDSIYIYTSNQGRFLGEHGWFGSNWIYEESIRIPLIIKTPWTNNLSSKVSSIVQNLDLAPTILDYAGIKKSDAMQGVSLQNLLEQGESNSTWQESVYYHYNEFPGKLMVAKHYGIRTQKYKLVHFYQFDEWEFYDLINDPSEDENLYNSDAFTSQIEKLKTLLNENRTKYADQTDISIMPEEWRKIYRGPEARKE